MATARLHAAREKLIERIVLLRDPRGHWPGRLSNSALSTATAISAISFYLRATDIESIEFVNSLESQIAEGLNWLVSHQNSDGGWGDTVDCYSNVSTTLLVLAALEAAEVTARFATECQRANAWLSARGGLNAIRTRYGDDRTFSVPILASAAMSGLIAWSEVPSLPFEAACVPQRFYNWLNLPVVSYAIPALVAIGQVKYYNDPPRNPVLRFIRKSALARSLSVVQRMQPQSGGFLEAIPLTSFVAMALIHCGRANHPIVERAIRFLFESFRPEGSWPIDTNLATWNTTLTINALGQCWPEQCADVTRWRVTAEWLLSCQYTVPHPFTGAEPGGWGWSDLSGAVPDADDTSGAMLALRVLSRQFSWEPQFALRMREAAICGGRWLLRLQNRDGGWPTFCKGWGRFPFDRSGTDITAHALRALVTWSSELANPQISKAIARGFFFLERQQNKDGSWSPLWFGNQDHVDENNPWYGTSKTLMAYFACDRFDTRSVQNGLHWLFRTQGQDGGWGGGRSVQRLGSELGHSTLEETALCLEVLYTAKNNGLTGDGELESAISRGLSWLIRAMESDEYLISRPIGFYFAKLWYDEQHYPIVFALSALGQAIRAGAD